MLREQNKLESIKWKRLHEFKKTDLFKLYLHKYLKICTPNKLPNWTINVDIAIITDEKWPSECAF